MVAKLLIMVLATAVTAVTKQTLMLLMMVKRKEEKNDFEAYLHCEEFGDPKEEGRTI